MARPFVNGGEIVRLQSHTDQSAFASRRRAAFFRVITVFLAVVTVLSWKRFERKAAMMESNVIDLSTRRPRTPKKRRPSFLRLPFIKKREHGGGYDYWAVAPTGKYGADCDRGTKFAHAFLSYLIKSGSPVGDNTMLSDITKDIAEKNDRSGLVIGFMGTIGRALGVGLLLEPRIVDTLRKAETADQKTLRAQLRRRPG